MQIFFNADKDLQKLNAQTEYQQIQIDFLKVYGKYLWRHQTIKNTINGKFMDLPNDLSFLLLYTTKIHDQGRGGLYTWIL